MFKVVEKIGGYQRVYEILKQCGWNGKYNTLFMQYYRRKASKDVALILWDYCNRHNIPVSIDDFRSE